MNNFSITKGMDSRQLCITGGLLLLIITGAVLAEVWQDDIIAMLGWSLDWLTATSKQWPILFATGYALLYVASLALLLPTDSAMIIIAGLNYPTFFAVIFDCTIHTLGTMASYWGTRQLIGKPVQQPTSPARIKAWWSLLGLRLVPFLPTHVATLALTRAPIGIIGFATATWIGSLPYTTALILSADYLVESLQQ